MRPKYFDNFVSIKSIMRKTPSKVSLFYSTRSLSTQERKVLAWPAIFLPFSPSTHRPLPIRKPPNPSLMRAGPCASPSRWRRRGSWSAGTRRTLWAPTRTRLQARRPPAPIPRSFLWIVGKRLLRSRCSLSSQLASFASFLPCPRPSTTRSSASPALSPIFASSSKLDRAMGLISWFIFELPNFFEDFVNEHEMAASCFFVRWRDWLLETPHRLIACS